MKAYDLVEVYLHLFFTVALEIRCELHAPAALPPMKVFPVHIESKSGWAPEPSERFEREKKKTLAHAVGEGGNRATVCQSSIP